MSDTTDVATLAATQWAMYGQWAGVVVTFAGLLGVVWQIRQASAGSDVSSLQTFIAGIKEHEANLSAGGENGFVEYLNFLEAYCALLNDGRLHKTTKRIVADKIQESIAMLEHYEAAHLIVSGAVTSITTFEEIQIFSKRNRRAIEMRRLSITKD